MDVIVCDIDGTVLDVNDRIARSLEDAGIDPGPRPSLTADALRRPERGRFLDIFLTEKYAKLDVPVPEVIEAVRQLQSETGLPLVFLSGRPDGMRRSTQEALVATGLTFKDILLRPRRERMKRTTAFKVDTIKGKGYTPAHVLDDDAEILAAFAAAFPAAKLKLVRGSQTTPWPD